MHSPLSVQEDAHVCDAFGPAPVRTMSSTPAMTSCGPASIPAGLTLGHTSTHLPHVVQASSIPATRSLSTVSKEMSFIAAHPALQIRCGRLPADGVFAETPPHASGRHPLCAASAAE